MGKHKIGVGLDAGSARTRCVVCGVEDTRVRLLGYGEALSRGWLKGRVADQAALVECTREAVRKAELDAQVSIDAVVAGVGGNAIHGLNNRGVYEFGRPREVEMEDVGYAVKLASKIELGDDRLLLQVLAQDFTVDGRAGFRNPMGAVCSRLEANVHIITTALQDHQGVVAACHQTHLAVEETIFEAMAAAYAAVLPEDRGRGVALVDIGAHSTEIAIYEGEAMVLADSIPVGGDHFTKDVVWRLCASFEDAQRLKEEYGCAILGLTSDNTLIEVPSAEGRAPREATRRQLNEVLEARAEELFLMVREKIRGVGMERSLLEGVILTGGGAALNGICDMAERVLNCQARNGLPVGIDGWPDDIDDPAWTTAAGLAMYSARLKAQRPAKRRVPGLVGMVFR